MASYAVILLLSILITTFNRGFFSLSGLAILVALFCLLVHIFIQKKKKSVENHSRLYDSYVLVFFISYSLSLFFSGGIYETNARFSFLISLTPIALFPVVLSFLKTSSTPKDEAYRFFVLLVGSGILRFLMIAASPSPVIDVFTILREAPHVFLGGGNPYEHVYSMVHPGIQTDYFAYFPAAFLLELPFVWLFSDPRVLLIVADIASSYLLYRVGGKKPLAQILALIYLFRPNSLFIIEQSWLTPLAFFLIAFSFFMRERARGIASGITLGALMALQPLYWAASPFFFMLPGVRLRMFTAACITAAGVILPFFIWSPASFVAKTILVYFKDPSLLPTIPVHLSLNLNTLFFMLTGSDISSYLSIGLSIMLLVWIVFALIPHLGRGKKVVSKKGNEDDKSQVLLGLVIFYPGFFLLFRQAFINYYYFATDLLILWLVVDSRT